VRGPSGPPATPIRAGHEAPGTIGFGTVLGDAYRIEEPLGQGGMGTVHAARHLRTGRRYAVKTILAGASASEDAIRRFEREATAASALGHPGIVQVHDFNVAPNGLFYLVMDLLEGETLATRLARTSPLAWADAQRIAVELCAALGAAHEHGLLHRDIKPSNVFLAKPTRATGTAERTVLVDFGLVKPLMESGSQLTSTGAVVGTPMYMSPEQARGETLDVRSDLYSLAAVLFETITGAPPFADRTMASVYARLLNDPPPLASRVSRRPVPREVDDVLVRALAKDRAARYPTARALGEAIARIADETAGAVPVTERMGS
jgi:serine/threonine-protein kinase